MRQKWPQKPPLGTPINWSHPLAKGLVGFWAFQEGGGDLANDLSGNGNHGTLENMAFPPTVASGWNPSKFGSALTFDGTDDYVDLGTKSMFYNNSQTVSFWFNSSGTNSDVRIVDGDYWGIYANNSAGGGTNNSLKGFVHDGTAFRETNWLWSNIQNGTWYHVAVTWNTDGNVKLYVNGGLKDTNTNYDGTIGISSGQTAIGSRYAGDQDFFNGQIDQVRIYNRALSAAEIIDSYLDPFGMFERNNLWDYVSAPPVGAVMNQFQKGNIGADLYDGVLIA